jgi:D-alanine-D-alanine ligase
MGTTAVIFGGPSPEHDVSILTGLQAARCLRGARRDVVAFYWAKSGAWFGVAPDSEANDFLEGVPKKAKALALRLGQEAGFYDGRKRMEVEVVVNCCHGVPGEDGTLAGALDLIGVPYTGPGVSDGVLGMDKLAFGALVASAGLPTLPRFCPGEEPPSGTGAPFIVKPRFGGSSLGIEIAEDLDTVKALAASSPHLRGGAVVEPYLPESRDLNIAIRSWPHLQLSAIEEPIRAGKGEILDYEAKYKRGGLEGAARHLPAEIPDPVASRIRSLAERVADLLPVRSIARLDFLLDGDELWVNEINTIPGVLASYLWIEPKVTFEQLLTDLVDEARRKPRRQFSSPGADGSVLRSAQSIAAKLGF